MNHDPNMSEKISGKCQQSCQEDTRFRESVLICQKASQKFNEIELPALNSFLETLS